MTMNPHTTATGLSRESKIASRSAASSVKKHAITPVSLLCAAFILTVTAIARVFYE